MSIFDDIGGLFGLGSGSSNKAATNNLQAVVNAVNAIPLPVLQQYTPEELVQQGWLTPEQVQVVQQNPSAFESLSIDPTSRQAQMSALSELQSAIDAGGLDAIDRSNLNDIRNQEITQQRGDREAILANARARGVGGSGTEIATQLRNQQAAATDQSNRDVAVAAQAQARKLAAIQQAGTLAGQINNQDYQQAADKAKAADAIAQWNAGNQQSVNNANTLANNQAQAANLASQQAISNQNVTNRNTAQQSNNNLPQQQFNNAVSRITPLATATNSLASQQNANQKNTNNGLGNLFDLGSTLYTVFSDEKLKEDVTDFDADRDLLGELMGHNYKYKDGKGLPEGEQTGVMAQDLEKTKAGKELVQDTPKGKVVNYGKAGGMIIASLADLNDRIKKIEGDKNDN